MKQLFALGLFLFALPLAAQQVVSVTSGEHAGYSRLVLRVNPNLDWEIVKARGMATLRFPAQELSFATTRVFDRISTDRIASLSTSHSKNGSELQLKLKCSCDVQGFAFKGNYIVVDVFDGPALGPLIPTETAQEWQPDALPFIQPSNAPAQFRTFVMSDAPAQPRILPDPPPQKEAPPAPQMAAPSAPDTGANIAMDTAETKTVVADMHTMAGAAVSDMNAAVNVEDNPEMLARIEAAQTQLLAQLTRAADQGLVNFVPVPAPAEVAKVEVVKPVPEAVAEPTPIDPQLMQQLSARTAYARPTEGALSDIVNQFAMPQCLDDSKFSMEGWGHKEGFSKQLASLRTQLLGEFDVPDANIAKEIVQLYLSYGLGAEARMMLDESGATLDNAAIYRDMANIIESDFSRVSGPVMQGAGCGGAHEMWYLAAGLGDYQVLEPLSITDIFSTYPIEVRALIGPPLAQAFIDRGQIDAGHVVLEIVRRAESGVTTAQRIAEARVMEAQGDLEGALKTYHALALEGGENAPDALISYARTLLETGGPVPDTLLLDLESASFFNRKNESANGLRLWEIKVRNVVEGADSALKQIKTTLAERPQMHADLNPVISNIFETTRADMMGDYPYAQTVLQYADMLDQGPAGDPARLKIAEEMTAIGLPETALDMLAPNLGRATISAKHIEAAAYVQLYQPAHALDILTGDESLAGYKIRLNAYLQMEDFTAVAQLLNQDFAKDISLNDVALRAGDWAKIKDAGAVGTLASYMQNTSVDSPVSPDQTLPPMVAEGAPSLKATRALLADNQKSMKFLEGVLAQGQ